MIKIIRLDENGHFKDTLNVKPGTYTLHHGKEFAFIYLRNGFDLNLKTDTEKFEKKISFSGTGIEGVNDYLLNRSLKVSDLFYLDLKKLDEASFNQKLNSTSSGLNQLLKKTKNVDSTFLYENSKFLKRIMFNMKESYKHAQQVKKLEGKESPKFYNYQNYAGGTTSLDDFKGKFVYIDVWATWCGPCLDELPLLKKVEKEYHNKNIEFVSISIDRKTDYEAWKAMVKKEELSGIQLFAKVDSNFEEAYLIEGIPRFILLDPDGKVIDANAPRPSSRDKLKRLFDSVL